MALEGSLESALHHPMLSDLDSDLSSDEGAGRFSRLEVGSGGDDSLNRSSFVPLSSIISF